MNKDKVIALADDTDSGRTTSGRRLFSEKNLLMFAQAIELAANRDALCYQKAMELGLLRTEDVMAVERALDADGVPATVQSAELVSQTLSGFMAAHLALTGYPPNDQEIFDAGVRAGKARAPQPSPTPVVLDERAALVTQISRMRKDENRGDTVFRCGFNGAIDAVLKLLAASPAAPAQSAQPVTLDMSLEARLADAEADVARLHKEKMDLLTKYVYATPQPAQTAQSAGYAFKCDGKLWVVTDPDVAAKWKAQGFEVIPVATHSAVVLDDEWAALTKLPWLDQSMADPIEKARRVLGHLIEPNQVYYFEDGFPRPELKQQAANCLTVLNALAASPQPVAQPVEQTRAHTTQPGESVMAHVTRTVYVNIYDIRPEDSTACNEAGAYDTEQRARSNAENNRARLLAIAVPVTITE